MLDLDENGKREKVDVWLCTYCRKCEDECENEVMQSIIKARRKSWLPLKNAKVLESILLGGLAYPVKDIEEGRKIAHLPEVKLLTRVKLLLGSKEYNRLCKLLRNSNAIRKQEGFDERSY
jgi:heterodisulfide reductase subunit C